MKELKAITVINAYQLECNDNDLVYLKSDVDKVLAENDAEIHRLKRALYKACANWADIVAFEETEGIGHDNRVAERWRKMERKCLKLAEEHKFREE